MQVKAMIPNKAVHQRQSDEFVDSSALPRIFGFLSFNLMFWFSPKTVEGAQWFG